jgi:hypothetical protein
VQLLLGHSKLESTDRYLGIEVADALEISEQTEIWVRARLSGQSPQRPRDGFVGAIDQARRAGHAVCLYAR